MDAEAFIEDIRSNAAEDFGDSYRLFGDTYSLHNEFYKWTRNPSFARRLGEALRGNTSIASMQVSMAMLACATSHDESDTDCLYNPLLEYVQNSTRLGEFSFEFMERYVDNEDVELLPTIAEAVATNSSIAKLELMFFLDSDAYRNNINEMVALLVLRQHPETLQELIWGLGFVDDDQHEPSIPMALETLFQVRSTNLKILRLWNVEINAEICSTLFETWQTSFATRAETVILNECEFTHEGSERFGKLLQTSKQNEICRGTNDHGDGAVVRVSLEMGDSGRSMCTLPSSFHSAFLVSTTGRIRVYELQSDIMFNLHLPILAHYLPCALYVQKLRFNMHTERENGSWTADDEERLRQSCELSAEAFQFPMPVLCHQALSGIRCNGSLTAFELSPHEDAGIDSDTEFFSATMERKLDAYLDRNRFLPRLLSEAATDIGLVPSLFAAATMAQSMAPTNLLIGLSKPRSPTGELLLGPRTICDAKRCNA
jgi:hypothetical protein